MSRPILTRKNKKKKVEIVSTNKKMLVLEKDKYDRHAFVDFKYSIAQKLSHNNETYEAQLNEACMKAKVIEYRNVAKIYNELKNFKVKNLLTAVYFFADESSVFFIDKVIFISDKKEIKSEWRHGVFDRKKKIEKLNISNRPFAESKELQNLLSDKQKQRIIKRGKNERT